MKLYIVEEYSIINMYDIVLQDYNIFTSIENAKKLYPDALVESEYSSESKLEYAIEEELNKPFTNCYVIVEKGIEGV